MDYPKVKSDLITRRISVKEFVDLIIAFDQSTEERENSLTNLDFILDPEIMFFIKNEPKENQIKFNQLLSFTELHVAQVTALGDYEFNILDVIEHMKKSLEYEYLAKKNPANIAYKKATLAYFENNYDNLISAIDEYKQVGESQDFHNLPFLENLRDGLKKRGCPDYKEDFHI